jgi:glycogen(starch) synthase
MVALEGMLYGLPIAASCVGGLAEILTHNVDGLLFPPRDAKALADALTALIRSPCLRKRLGRAAAREVRRRWLYSRVAEEMICAYAELRSRFPPTMIHYASMFLSTEISTS